MCPQQQGAPRRRLLGFRLCSSVPAPVHSTCHHRAPSPSSHTQGAAMAPLCQILPLLGNSTFLLVIHTERSLTCLTLNASAQGKEKKKNKKHANSRLSGSNTASLPAQNTGTGTAKNSGNMLGNTLSWMVDLSASWIKQLVNHLV